MEYTKKGTEITDDGHVQIVQIHVTPAEYDNLMTVVCDIPNHDYVSKKISPGFVVAYEKEHYEYEQTDGQTISGDVSFKVWIHETETGNLKEFYLCEPVGVSSYVSITTATREIHITTNDEIGYSIWFVCVGDN